MAAETLRECPLCGSTTAPALVHDVNDTYVACYGSKGGCGARSGGIANDDPHCERDAVAEWNRRPEPSPASQSTESRPVGVDEGERQRFEELEAKLQREGCLLGAESREHDAIRDRLEAAGLCLKRPCDCVCHRTHRQPAGADRIARNAPGLREGIRWVDHYDSMKLAPEGHALLADIRKRMVYELENGPTTSVPMEQPAGAVDREGVRREVLEEAERLLAGSGDRYEALVECVPLPSTTASDAEYAVDCVLRILRKAVAALKVKQPPAAPERSE